MPNTREEIIRRLEGYMKFKNISKQDLAKKWGKKYNYIYRRFSGEVEFDLKDILKIFNVLNLSKEEVIFIFFK